MDLGYAIFLFSSDEDVTSYIEPYNINTNNTIVYGLSYGTYWLNRYLQLFPEQPDAVIFDSLCPSDECRIATFDYGLNHGAMLLMQQWDMNFVGHPLPNYIKQ